MGRVGKPAGKVATKEKRGGEAALSAAVKSRAGKHPLWLAAIFVLTLAAYSNCFQAPFLLDNDPVILQDNRIRAVSSEHMERILAQQYWPANLAGLYRPLTTLSFLFNYAVLGNGAAPGGYHWLNLLLHALNIALVYLLGLVLFEEIPAAALLAALWGLHPVLTESVTNIVGRADLLSAFGVLAALLAYRRSLRTSGARKAAWIAAVALAVTIGVFSKESGIVAVAAIALYDFAFERTAPWRSRIPGYLAVAVPSLVFLFVRARVLANAAYAPFPFCDNPLVGASFWTARATAVKVIGKYFGLLLWPARLSYDYSFNAIPLFGWTLRSREDWKAIATLMVCAAGAAVAIRSWRRHRPLFFAIPFFFATLSPAANLVILIGSIMAERFLYLPAVGFLVAVVYVLRGLWRRVPAHPARRYAALAAVSAMLVASGARTWERNRDWADPQRFWRRGLEAAPASYRVHLAAATNSTPVTGQDWDRSLNEVWRALYILDPLPDLENSGVAYRQAGIVYRTLGDRLASQKPEANSPAEATPVYWYRKSLDVLVRSERIERVQDERNRRENANRGKPGLTFMPAAVYLELGRTLMRLPDPLHALKAFEQGRMLESNPDLLEELGAAYRAAGDLRKASLALVEALAMDSTRTRIASQLVDLYTAIDPKGCAVVRQGGESILNPECPLVHGDICAASRNVIGSYLRKGQHFEADAIRRTATEELGCAPQLLQ